MSRELYKILNAEKDYRNRDGIRKNNITFFEVYRQWHRNTQDGVLSKATADASFHSMDIYTIPNFGEKPIQEVSLSNLQTVLDVYALMGNTADWYIHAKLRSLYDYAIEKGYVSDNLGYRLKSDNNPAGVKLVLSDQEIRDFFMICDEAYTMYSCMFAVALYTGMRIREVMAMAHGQIDRKMGTVKIQSQIKDGKLVPAVKTRRGRKIRLSRTEDVALEEPGMAFNYLKLELKKQANNLGMPKEELMKSDRLIITHPGSDKNTSSHRIHRSTENGIGLGSAGKA